MFEGYAFEVVDGCFSDVAVVVHESLINVPTDENVNPRVLLLCRGFGLWAK